MRDLSLHILDLIENSIRAGASVISVNVLEDPSADTLCVSVEDDGGGLSVPPEVATDPFYTTKGGKRTGLGLSLLRSTAEEAGGRVSLGRSSLGGLAVEAVMRLRHVDRRPLGDLAATVASVACTNPEIDLRCRFSVGGREFSLRVPDEMKALPREAWGGLAVARRVAERMRAGLAALQSTA